MRSSHVLPQQPSKAATVVIITLHMKEPRDRELQCTEKVAQGCTGSSTMQSWAIGFGKDSCAAQLNIKGKVYFACGPTKCNHLIFSTKGAVFIKTSEI